MSAISHRPSGLRKQSAVPDFLGSLQVLPWTKPIIVDEHGVPAGLEGSVAVAEVDCARFFGFEGRRIAAWFGFLEWSGGARALQMRAAIRHRFNRPAPTR